MATIVLVSGATCCCGAVCDFCPDFPTRICVTFSNIELCDCMQFSGAEPGRGCPPSTFKYGKWRTGSKDINGRFTLTLSGQETDGSDNCCYFCYYSDLGAVVWQETICDNPVPDCSTVEDVQDGRIIIVVKYCRNEISGNDLITVKSFFQVEDQTFTDSIFSADKAPVADCDMTLQDTNDQVTCHQGESASAGFCNQFGDSFQGYIFGINGTVAISPSECAEGFGFTTPATWMWWKNIGWG